MAYTLQQIKHAEALARHRNFREAAVELSISQPALTRSIKSLEAILVPEALARLVGLHPELTYRISEMDWSDIPQSLLTRNFDIAVADIGSVDDDPRFDTELLIDDPFFYVADGTIR